MPARKETKKMKAHRRLAFVAAFLPVSAASVSRTDAQSVTFFNTATVVDVHNKTLGNLADLNTQAGASILLATADGAVVDVKVSQDTLLSFAGLFFVTEDCTGTAYALRDRLISDPLVPYALLGPPGTTLYRKDLTAAHTTPTLRSEFKFGDCSSPAQDAPPVDPVPLLPVIDLDTQFAAPFHVVAPAPVAPTSCCGDCNGNGEVTINELVTAVGSALTACPTAGAVPQARR
jgi:hypothetical protein